PVGRAVDTGEHLVVAFGCWIVAGNDLRAPLVIETTCPSLSDETLRQQEFAAVSVQQIVEAVTSRPRHQAALLASEWAIKQHRNLRGVPIMRVVGRELVIPLELAGIGIEGEHGARVEVVTGAEIPVVVRPWIAGAPEHGVRDGVIGTGVPGRDASGFPGIAGP